ncbi:MAG: NADH:ubiquinone oxidoreductase subunit NDUFA12 [Alphaproteobacteria bacterium]|nr:NADH:ubiquinone oxidoreductase subunit NDUFA12 [Alphaproteobacteria bacterium]MCB9975808.1 NADH:ubiquinone oxidoreductase subunit NDUFA12 [Rhodospirillales bacterium]
MGFFSFLGPQSPAYTTFFTLFSGGKRVGIDQSGNKYYEAAPRKGYKRPRRWVIYKGEPEASKVPPEWHGWLHHQTNTVPGEAESYRRPWQKPHQPNLTGTSGAYRPPGHILEGGVRDKATGDYEPWMPSD